MLSQLLGKKYRRRFNRRLLLLEALEERSLPSTFTVLNLNDGGAAHDNVVNFSYVGTGLFGQGDLGNKGLGRDDPGLGRARRRGGSGPQGAA